LQIQTKTINFALVTELERHIEIQLLTNDCVIVPDLGGFMAHHVEARHDDRDNMFLPPLRTLGFNPKLNMNDSLLAQSYIEAYDISYPDAVQRIENEVNELKQHIENDGCYELADIGTLHLNENGSYGFTPCEAGILTPELYGLYSFEMAGLTEPDKETARAVITEIPETVPDAINNQEEEDKKSLAAALNGNNTDGREECKTIKIRVDLLRNVIAAAVAIFAFFFISTPMGDSTEGMKMMNMSNGVIYRLMPKDITLPVNTAMPVNKKKELAERSTETEISEKAGNKDEETGAIQPYYTIVLASRVAVRNAEAYVDKLHKQGLTEAFMYRSSKGGTKVVYGHYKTDNEALDALRTLRADETFSQGWIYKIKD